MVGLKMKNSAILKWDNLIDSALFSIWTFVWFRVSAFFPLPPQNDDKKQKEIRQQSYPVLDYRILQQNLGWHKYYDSISAKAYRQLAAVLSHHLTQYIPRRSYTGSLTAVVLLTTLETYVS